MTAPPPTTVVVPVHDGRDETLRCLGSVLRHAGDGPPFELLVVDDASPDPVLRVDLDRIATAPAPVPVRLLRNEVNRGFVASVNRALLETAGDVVLLNSDTVVTDGWLHRLCATAASAPDVATVTPLTNAGSICTLPAPVIEHFGLSGPDPRVDECARFVATAGLGLRPAVITGVGFCMLVTRAALDACGLLDEATFGQGYGEEVDLCLRASALGFRHLVDDRTYVHHEEGVSFGASRAERMARASAVLRERYPDFAAANRRERAADPLAVSFEALVLALHEPAPGRRHVLHVLHAPSSPLGGTERHVEALVAATAAEVDSSVLAPDGDRFVLRRRVQTADGAVVDEHLLPGRPASANAVDDEQAAVALQVAIDAFEVDVVHLHNLLGHSLAALRVCEGFDGPVLCTLHDLRLACPNHSLLHRDTVACGVPDDLSVCAGCLPETRVGGSLELLERYRGFTAAHLSAIDTFVAADVTAVDALRRAHPVPDDRVVVVEHGTLVAPLRAPLDDATVLTGPLRLAFVGRAWRKKGLEVVNHLAASLDPHDVELHHFGESRDPVHPSVRVHGTYDNAELPGLLHRAGIHVVLLPGPYAETYSYVMSEALAAGLPVIGAGYGALGHRIRTHEVGWTIDPTDPTSVEQLVRDLHRCRPEVLRATRRARAVATPPAGRSAARHLELYRASARREGTAAMDDGLDRDDRMRRHVRALTAVNHQLREQVRDRSEPRPRRLARARASLRRRAPRLVAAAGAARRRVTRTARALRARASSDRRSAVSGEAAGR